MGLIKRIDFAATRTYAQLLAVVSLVLASGCLSTTTLPEHWASAKEAFPDKKSTNPPHEKEDAYVVATFRTPYEDVYRAALVSASQAMFNVTEENKREGYILAERIATIVNTSIPVHYYYAIRIDEIHGKESRVTIAAKAQRECGFYGHFAIDIDICTKQSELHWVDKRTPRSIGDPNPEGTKAEMTQVIVFIRNNLIAAGLQ